MSHQKDTDFIVSELAKYRNHNDVIKDLSEQSGYRWDEAAAIVHRVESEQDQAIQVRRRPILTVLGVMYIIGGLALIVAGVYSALIGEAIPLTLSIGPVEIDFPNGGQTVPIVAGFPTLLGGVVGTIYAYKETKSSET
ncbi:MAG: hypothetical protein GY832_36220 [Chloroflexi bacterium]|nr:hypothetical protein [Chloroflexota bacterium]